MNKREYLRAWRAANPDLVKAIQRASDKKRQYTARRRAQCLAAGARYRKKHPTVFVQQVALRRARKRANACACCAPISFKFIYLQARSLKMEVDHVQPLSRGGQHCLRNLQLLEPHANRTKSAKWEAIQNGKN